jgi:hypothetical protein
MIAMEVRRQIQARLESGAWRGSVAEKKNPQATRASAAEEVLSEEKNIDSKSSQ